MRRTSQPRCTSTRRSSARRGVTCAATAGCSPAIRPRPQPRSSPRSTPTTRRFDSCSVPTRSECQAAPPAANRRARGLAIARRSDRHRRLTLSAYARCGALGSKPLAQLELTCHATEAPTPSGRRCRSQSWCRRGHRDMATATASTLTSSSNVRARPRGNGRGEPRGNDAHGDVAGILVGTGVLLIQACALIPGLLPCLLLTAALAVPLVLPGIVIGLVIALPGRLWRCDHAAVREVLA